MIRCGNDCAEYHRWISYGDEDVEALPEPVLASPFCGQPAPENARMEQHGATDAESIS